MLVLTRKIGETIRIGDEITVRVLGVRGGQVSLGFVAPANVRIFREEVVRSIEKQNLEAVVTDPGRLAEAARIWEDEADAEDG
ncbi:MAG TPA: carbon storage regulator CsrA [Candidatus Binatia bacterium]|nr:carbon storage regulator CsrA [Candidatus Binatia bacterium]